MSKARVVTCPTCGATVEWTPTARWRPFCSERCKTIDLGAWATESYRVPLAEVPEGGEAEAAQEDERHGSGATS